MKPGVDYIGVGVGAVIFNSEGKLLLTKRGNKSRNEVGKWEIPGGRVQWGERLEDAIKREVKEELGVDIEIIELLDVYDHLIPDEKQHWVSPCFICKIAGGSPAIMEEGKLDEIGWFSLTEMIKLPLSIITRQNLETFKKKFPNRFA